MGRRDVKRALLLGGTGAVGRSCLDVLTRRRDVSVLIAGRDVTRLRQVASSADPDIATVRLDVADAAAIASAAEHCDVVINCAGPSRQFSAHVAEAAVAAGVPYVDPGGDQVLLAGLAAAGTRVPVVLQAGVQPGLSGLLLRALAQHWPDTIGGVTAWCGGLQPLTPASVLEYLASLVDTDGYPGAVLRDGVIQRVSRQECKPAPTQYFPDSATVRVHIDAETVAVAEHLGIGDVCWMNVFDGVHTTRAMQLLAVDDERPRGQADLGDVLAASKLDLFGREPYFAIVGRGYGEVGSATVAFSCPDSFRVTGALVAFAVEHVAVMSAGAQPFWSIDEPGRVLEFLARAVPESAVSFVDGRTAGGVDSPMVEEGSL